MAKQREKTKGQKAAETAGRAASGLMSLSVWAIGIGVLVVAGYFLFRKEGPATEDRSPRGVYTAYISHVRAYIPPSQTKPSSLTIDQWLDYFDSRSVDWFEDHVDTLSFVRFQRDPAAWKALSRDERRSEAMAYVLTQNPLRGGAVEKLYMDDGGEGAELTVRAGGQLHEFSMVKDGRSWKARDLMGKMPDFNQVISETALPN